MDEYKLAIIGSKDAIAGFKALGVEPFSVSTSGEAKEALLKVTSEDDKVEKYAIVFITEDFAEMIAEDIKERSQGPLPSIVPIPSYQGSKGIGQNKLRHIVEQAVGSDILFREDSN